MDVGSTIKSLQCRAGQGRGSEVKWYQKGVCVGGGGYSFLFLKVRQGAVDR